MTDASLVSHVLATRSAVRIGPARGHGTSNGLEAFQTFLGVAVKAAGD